MNAEHIHNELWRALMRKKAVSTQSCRDRRPVMTDLSKQLLGSNMEKA